MTRFQTFRIAFPVGTLLCVSISVALIFVERHLGLDEGALAFPAIAIVFTLASVILLLTNPAVAKARKVWMTATTLVTGLLATGILLYNLTGNVTNGWFYGTIPMLIPGYLAGFYGAMVGISDEPSDSA